MTYHFHKSLETNISIEAISWPETPPAPLIREPHGTVVEDPQILWRTPDFQKGPQVIHWRPQDFHWRDKIGGVSNDNLEVSTPTWWVWGSLISFQTLLWSGYSKIKIKQSLV